MKYIPIVVFVLLSVFLTYEESPRAIYNDIKSDLREKGIDIGYQWDEVIRLKSMRPGLYGVSLDMNAYAQSVHILLNTQEWRKMNKTQRKLLLLHECMHSFFEAHHCYNRSCIMSGGHISRWKDANYEEILKNTLACHRIGMPSGYNILRIKTNTN